MEESPNSLKPPKPQTRGLSKKPMYIILVAVAVMFGLLWYAIEQTDKRQKTPEAEKKPQADTRLIDQNQDKGLALPPAQTPAVVMTDPPQAGRQKEPLVVVQQATAVDKEAETLRKRKEQQYFTALSAPLVTKRGGSQAVKETPSTEPVQQTASIQTVNEVTAHPPNEAYNPAADEDKEGFFTRADTKDGNSGWLSRYTREPGRKFEIKTGHVLPAVMITGINSDLPGSMIAQVSQNIYDTATGKYLLFPQGAKLFGAYDSRIVYGQQRVLVAWNRVVFPDGTSVTLGAMPGTDMSGYAGFEDQVNNHYLRIFGASFLMSAITAGTSYAVDSTSNTNNDSTKTTFQDAMASALAAQMGSATLRLLEKNLNIKPTLEIRPGYQFNVVATKDIAFKAPYRDGRYAAER